MSRRVRKNGSVGTMLWLAGGAAAAYFGYRWWKKGRSAPSVLTPIVQAVTAAVAPGTSGEQAWGVYQASAMRRESLPLTYDQFMSGWAALTAAQQDLMLRAFALSSEQAAALQVSDPALAAAYVAAAMALMAPAMVAQAALPVDAKTDVGPAMTVTTGVDPNGQQQVTSVKGIGGYYAG